MAEKELRKMNRTELIEIIYALQQDELALKQENDRLKAELNEKTIRIDEAGSIAEAALSLNKIFEDAQAAADQYLTSVKAKTGLSEPETDSPAEKTDSAEEEEVSPKGNSEEDQILSSAAVHADKKGEDQTPQIMEVDL